jgi:hypothetical protein
MVLGMWPTAVGNSEGSEFRAPMAIAVIGGVISSTLLSLLVVPVVYLTIENLKAWLPRAWHASVNYLRRLFGGKSPARQVPAIAAATRPES